MATRFLKRTAAPFTVLVSVIALALAMIGTATADPTAPPISSTGDRTADNLGWNFQVVGDNILEPGDTVTYRASIWENSKAGGFLNLGRYITAMRQVAPAGFEYESSVVSMDATVSSEGDDGVKATCTGGGCKSAPLNAATGFKVIGGTVLTYDVTFKVPADHAPGDYDSSFIFDVATFSSAQGASPSGVKVRVEDSRVSTTTTLELPAKAGLGSETELKAKVTPAGAEGTVQFYIDGTGVGSPQTVDASGTAALGHTFDAMGDFAISAKYTATGGHHDSEATAQTLEVGNIDTATALEIPATAEAGASVALKANVTPANAQGTVQFAVDGVNVGNPVSVSGGQATLDHRFDNPGAPEVTASFVGGFGFENSEAAAQQVSVAYGAWQTTTVVVEPVFAESGSPTNLMATVRPIPTGGEIIFRVDGSEVGRADVGTADGVAVLEHTFGAAGAYQVVAEYTGTAGFDESTSGAFTATVQDAPPVLTAVDANLSVQGLSVEGQTVTLIATVNPADAVGTVQFYKGAEAIGGPIEVVEGKATITTSLEFEGTQVLSAKFLGGDGFRDTVSNPVVLNVSGQPEAPEEGAGSLGSLLDGPLAGLLAGSLGG
ncbi:Ig-like domain-containing protein [Tomitella biformata]|uniref:Ig-like domain-containing protein n=1 Tax=Tomitella biformata TaxID=630403 RepID=UPI0004652A38|nr:Ig-like domain-containing protein [Tomitella biformata]